MAATTLHNYPTSQHLVQALYALRAVDGAFGALRCIRFQFSVSEFPRIRLLGNRVNSVECRYETSANEGFKKVLAEHG